MAAEALLSNTKMLTLSEVMALAQGPLLMVHSKMFSPIVKPVTALVGSLGLTTTPVPLTRTQLPTAGNTGAFAASEVELIGEHRTWSDPALAGACEDSKMKILTSSVVWVGEQGPLEMVHRNTFSPWVSPVICVLELFGLSIVPDPETRDQTPEAG